MNQEESLIHLCSHLDLERLSLQNHVQKILAYKPLVWGILLSNLNGLGPVTNKHFVIK